MKSVFGEYSIYVALGLTIALVIHYTKNLVQWNTKNLAILFAAIFILIIVINLMLKKKS